MDSVTLSKSLPITLLTPLLAISYFSLRETNITRYTEVCLKGWGAVISISLSSWEEKAMAPHSSTLPGKSHGRRSLVGYSPWGRKESDMAERLHFHFYALEKEMATHSSVLAWRIPGTGSHRVRHDWSDLAVAAVLLGSSVLRVKSSGARLAGLIQVMELLSPHFSHL